MQTVCARSSFEPLRGETQTGHSSNESQSAMPAAGTTRVTPSGHLNATDEPQRLHQVSSRHNGGRGSMQLGGCVLPKCGWYQPLRFSEDEQAQSHYKTQGQEDDADRLNHEQEFTNSGIMGPRTCRSGSSKNSEAEKDTCSRKWCAGEPLPEVIVSLVPGPWPYAMPKTVRQRSHHYAEEQSEAQGEPRNRLHQSNDTFFAGIVELVQLA